LDSLQQLPNIERAVPKFKNQTLGLCAVLLIQQETTWATLSLSKQLQPINTAILSHECLLIISWLPSTVG
tara:strand:+ start:281 stop:490 length:210 start_codon:yes stop_codon:yes gene_type:complete